MAASYASAVFVTKSGETLYKDVYLSDTANGAANFDGGAGASSTSPTDFRVPVDCWLRDVCIAAATGQTKTQINKNDAGTGNILRNSLHLASITFRPQLNIPYQAGSKVTFIQLA